MAVRSDILFWMNFENGTPGAITSYTMGSSEYSAGATSSSGYDTGISLDGNSLLQATNSLHWTATTADLQWTISSNDIIPALSSKGKIGFKYRFHSFTNGTEILGFFRDYPNNYLDIRMNSDISTNGLKLLWYEGGDGTASFTLPAASVLAIDTNYWVEFSWDLTGGTKHKILSVYDDSTGSLVSNSQTDSTTSASGFSWNTSGMIAIFGDSGFGAASIYIDQVAISNSSTADLLSVRNNASYPLEGAESLTITATDNLNA